MYKDIKLLVPLNLLADAGLELIYNSKNPEHKDYRIKCDRFEGAVCTPLQRDNIEITFTNEDSLIHLVEHLIELTGVDGIEKLVVNRTHYYSDEGFKPFTDEVRETDKKYLEATEILKNAFIENWKARGNEMPDGSEMVIEIGIKTPRPRQRINLSQIMEMVETMFESELPDIPSPSNKPNRPC